MPKSWLLVHNNEWKYLLDQEDREQFELEVHGLMVPYLLTIIEQLRRQVYPEEYKEEPDERSDTS